MLFRTEQFNDKQIGIVIDGGTIMFLYDNKPLFIYNKVGNKGLIQIDKSAFSHYSNFINDYLYKQFGICLETNNGYTVRFSDLIK